jgi:hypothetical protein
VLVIDETGRRRIGGSMCRFGAFRIRWDPTLREEQPVCRSSFNIR